MESITADWVEIYHVRCRWAQGLDTCDWSLLRSVLCDDVRVDYSGWSGKPAETMRADDWVEARKGLFPGLSATQHSLSNPRITVDADRATSLMYVVADHVLDDTGERWFTLGGVYSDEFRRIDGRWLLSSMTLTPRWYRGDRSVMDEGRRRAAELLSRGAG